MMLHGQGTPIIPAMTSMTQRPAAAQATVGMDAEHAAGEATNYWWLGVVTGVMWLLAALVVLQFDQASVKTVGLIIGCMFLAAGTQQFVAAAIGLGVPVLRLIFGLLFVVCGLVALFNPEDTFAGVADTLGFLFLIVAVSWMIEAFVGGVRWLRLCAALLMLALAFWTSGQFFVDKAYVLLVFAGIWALLHGVTDIVAAFFLRSVKTALSAEAP
jgi:uncharacterized membrane protein HdeD (DUF308 family)